MVDPFLEYLFHSPSTVTYFTRRRTATYDLSVRFFSIFASRHRGRGHSETFKHDFTVRTPPRASSKRVPILTRNATTSTSRCSTREIFRLRKSGQPFVFFSFRSMLGFPSILSIKTRIRGENCFSVFL